MGTTSTGGLPESAWGPGTKDRRETLRHNVVDSHLVTVDLAFQSGALLLDLSETGIGVQALSSAPAGNTTSLHFELPETGGRVEAIGRIAWTDSSGRLGIRFEEMAEPSRVHLAQWLAREPRSLPVAGVNASMPSWPPAHMRDEIAAMRRDLVTQKLEGEEALAFIVERTRSVTRATGTAIALEEDGNVVCRASSGNAPGLGAHLDPNSGLSGECVRTGEIVRCEDTETDPRADRLVCRKLDLRSIVIVPVRIHGHLSGVLEAFSSRAHAFQSSDVLLLRRVADLVAGIAVRQPDLAHPTPAGPHAVMASTVLEPLEPLESLEPLEPLEALQSPPRPETVSGTAPLMIDDILALDFIDSIAQEPLAPLEVVIPAPTPISTKPLRTEIPVQPVIETTAARFQSAEPVTEPDGEEVAAAAALAALEIPPPDEAEMVREAAAARDMEIEPPAAPAAKVAEVAPPATPSIAAIGVADDKPVVTPLSTTTAAAAAPAPARVTPRPVASENRVRESWMTPSRDSEFSDVETQETSRWNMRIIGAAILAGVLLIGGYYVWHSFAPIKGTPMDSELKNAQPSPAPATPVNTSATAPAEPVNPAPAPAPVTTKPAAAPKPAAKPKEPAPDADEVTTRVVNPAALSKKPPEKPAAASSTPPPSEAPKTEEGPPEIGFISRPVVESSAIANMLHTPVMSPSLDKTVPVSQITGGKLIQRVQPTYPHSAAGMYGQVTLTASVGMDGRVKSVKIVSGNAVLAQSAAAAVRRWRYTPYILNGHAIEVENTIVVDFRPPNR
jgi:TonB family protein